MHAGSLTDLVEEMATQHQRLPAHHIIAIFIQVAEALQAMHRLPSGPVIHRLVESELGSILCLVFGDRFLSNPMVPLLTSHSGVRCI